MVASWLRWTGNQKSKGRSGELSERVEFQQHWGTQLSRTKASPKVGEPDDPDPLFVGFSIKSPCPPLPLLFPPSSPPPRQGSPGLLQSGRGEKCCPEAASLEGTRTGNLEPPSKGGSARRLAANEEQGERKGPGPLSLVLQPAPGTFSRRASGKTFL